MAVQYIELISVASIFIHDEKFSQLVSENGAY